MILLGCFSTPLKFQENKSHKFAGASSSALEWAGGDILDFVQRIQAFKMGFSATGKDEREHRNQPSLAITIPLVEILCASKTFIDRYKYEVRIYRFCTHTFTNQIYSYIVLAILQGFYFLNLFLTLRERRRLDTTSHSGKILSFSGYHAIGQAGGSDQHLGNFCGFTRVML